MKILLCRHGETEWSLNGKHTSFSNISLTDKGLDEARALKEMLDTYQIDTILTSPLARAQETCDIVGFFDREEIEPDLFEWNYGEYEGLTTVEIQQLEPGWNIFTHGALGGESVEDVTERADRLIEKLLKLEGTVLCFSSGHFSRALAARWVGLPISAGKVLKLSTASLSVLAYEHDYRVIELWNQT